MKVFIAGLGSIGQRHLRNLRALRSVEVVTYRMRGLALPQEFTGDWIRSYSDLGRALAEKPEIALICGPPSTQLRLAQAVAEAGCHLFIEKPLSHSYEGVPRLLETVASRSLITQVGYNLRFHPVLQRLKALLDSGALGKVSSLVAHVGQYLPDWHPWEDYRAGYSARRELGGGVVLDLIHELDYARWLMGEIVEVRCFAAHTSHLEISTEDTAEMILRFASGRLGALHLDYVHRAGFRGGFVVGDQGAARYDLVEPLLSIYNPALKQWEDTRYPEFSRAQMYLDEMRHFIECVERGAQTSVPLREGAAVLAHALTARDSSGEGDLPAGSQSLAGVSGA